jgi:hypothetical protein
MENVKIDHHYAQCITEPFEQHLHKSGVKIVRKTFLTYSFEKIQKLNVAGLNKFGFRKCHLVTLCVKVATTFLGFWALCIMVVVL